jgi:hypothetical protein
MVDRVAQPADGVGINPVYSGGLFLWNGIAPTKNQLNGATDTLAGTTVSGAADGTYHLFTVAGEMAWSISAFPSTYTLVLLSVFPSASVSDAKIFSIPGGGVRVMGQTTGGGVYHKLIHTGVAAATEIAESVSGFDGEMWTFVARQSAGSNSKYLKRGDGTTVTTVTESLTNPSTGGTTLHLGDDGPLASFGLYACMLIDNDVGDTEALAIRDNGWRIFAPEGTGSSHLGYGLTTSGLLRGKL